MAACMGPWRSVGVRAAFPRTTHVVGMRQHFPQRCRVHAVEPQDTLFKREGELERFRALKAEPPSGIQLIVGPRNGGKTAIAQKFAKEEQARVIYVNLRGVDTRTPDAFLKQFMEQLADRTGRKDEWKDIISRGAQPLAQMAMDLFQAKPPAVKVVMKAVNAMLPLRKVVTAQDLFSALT